MPLPSYREHYLPALSESNIRSRMADPRHLFLLPLGATEQHGPHLPVGTDSLIGDILLSGILSALGNDFPLTVLPALPITKSNEHTGFPGTLTIGKSTLLSLLNDMLDGLEAQGASRFAFLNTHGGNTAWLRTALRERACTSEATYHLLNPMPENGMNERESNFGIHAGEYESALLYAAIPECCKPQLADCQWIDQNLSHPDLRPEFAPVTFAWVASDLSPSGTMGDATQATAQKGQQWISAAVDQLCTELKALIT